MFEQVTKSLDRRPQNIKETKSPSRIIEGQCGWGYKQGIPAILCKNRKLSE
ncbi:MAG: hypothetical protein II278_05280 [Bacteroidaceae bacterium]|jgi:hypothetical protein|nr:hypothetical protein [Bacteroidaceae bacterium]